MVRLPVMAEVEGTAEVMATLLDLEANPLGGKLAIRLIRPVLCICTVCTTSFSFSLCSILYIPLLSMSPNRHGNEESRCFSTSKRGATALRLKRNDWALGKRASLPCYSILQRTWKVPLYCAFSNENDSKVLFVIIDFLELVDLFPFFYELFRARLASVSIDMNIEGKEGVLHLLD